MAEQIGEIIVANGFDKITQLHGSLTKEWMSYLNIDRQSQDRILTYLSTVEDRRPKAGRALYNNFCYFLFRPFYIPFHVAVLLGTVILFIEFHGSWLWICCSIPGGPIRF